MVTLGIRFDAGYPRYENFYVVLSKRLQVLNRPIDMEKINSESNPDNYLPKPEEF